MTMWSYYGAKTNIVDLYPPPKHNKIIEPFAGSARYALKYFDKDVLLIDKYDVIVKIWKWLQLCSPGDILKLPISKSCIITKNKIMPQITLTEASELTERFQSANPGAIIAHRLPASDYSAILAQDGCEYIRHYNGLDSELNRCLIAVGVDASGNDMTSGYIAEMSIPCPQMCSQPNELNHY